MHLEYHLRAFKQKHAAALIEAKALIYRAARTPPACGLKTYLHPALRSTSTRP